MRDSPYLRYSLIIGSKKLMKMTLKRRMKINKTILNPITMPLPLALTVSVESTNSRAVTTIIISSKRVKISI